MDLVMPAMCHFMAGIHLYAAIMTAPYERERTGKGRTVEVSMQEATYASLAAKVPCAPVRGLAEVMNDRNMHERGSLQWIDHPDLGRVVLPHSPLVFEGSERLPIEPSLPLGAQNDAIFGDWLGHSPQELAVYKAQGIIS